MRPDPHPWRTAPARTRLGRALGASAAALAAALFTLHAMTALKAGLAALGYDGPGFSFAAGVAALAALGTLYAGATSVLLARRAASTAAQDVAAARELGARAGTRAAFAFGCAVALALANLLVLFLSVNEMAVGRTFFSLELIRTSFWPILQAFWLNVEIFVVAEVLILVWGLVVALARLAPGTPGLPLRAMATVYIDLFRGLPAIISIYLIGFGLPLTGLPYLTDIQPVWLAILAMTLTYGAYVAEVYRAGIESVHRSQTAAARSLGLSHTQTLRFVVLPQALRRIVPPLLNDFISLQKDTALVNVIGAVDAFNQAKIMATNHFNLSSVTAVALIFVVITIPQARLADRLLARDQQRSVGGSA